MSVRTETITRRTVSVSLRVEGVGLFTGASGAVEISPASAGDGIAFEREGVRIPATIDHLSAVPVHPAFEKMPPRCTSLEREGVVVHTVEHIMAALAGLGITDATVRTEGPEIPIGDGSAAGFVRPILGAGLHELGSGDPTRALDPIRVKAPIRVERDGSSIIIEPSAQPEYVYTLDYGPGAPIPSGAASWEGGGDAGAAFAERVAPARTFSLQGEAEAMRAMGMFTHLTPRDMLVFGEDGPIENELRFPDEPARHKLLDLIGDLALVGGPICARIIADRSGHALAHEAARRLIAVSRA